METKPLDTPKADTLKEDTTTRLAMPKRVTTEMSTTTRPAKARLAVVAPRRIPRLLAISP
jgi:hypothetical protein